MAETCFVTLLGGFVAFSLVLAEMKLLAITHVLTFSVFGQVKQIVQVRAFAYEHVMDV